jgi:ribosome biogenesis GTPase
MKALSGFYFVRTGGDEYMCRGRGILRREGVTPLVGDRVAITVQDEEEGVIDRVYARRNSFVRPPVANIDAFVCVIAVADPAPNPEILDRFLVTAEAADVPAIVCVNKVDLCSDNNARDEGVARDESVAWNENIIEEIIRIYGNIYNTVATSTLTCEGIADLEKLIAGKTVAFAGPSGVGKSSLIGLLTEETPETGEVSRKTGRGRHTTRHVEIFDTDFGARIFDTPGYTSFEGLSVEEEILAECFPEIWDAAGGCRFDNCTHTEEPDCAVRAAVDAGKIAASRYDSYVRMRERKA